MLIENLGKVVVYTCLVSPYLILVEVKVAVTAMTYLDINWFVSVDWSEIDVYNLNKGEKHLRL